MVSVRVAAFVAMTALFATASRAADMPQLPPVYAPPIEEAGGWYLRGDIGMSNQSVGRMRQRFEDVTAEQFSYVSKDFDSAPIFGIGFGYQFNNWLRADLTAEYRGRANLHARAVGNQGSMNLPSGSKSEITTLVNAYVDLGTWWNVTPFVGAGIGVSYNRIHDFYDMCTAGVCAGQITAVADGTGSKWSFAWAAHAGVAYKVNSSFTIELAYRYINLGSAESGWFHNVNAGLSVAPGPYQFKNIDSHDFRFGVRWMLEPPIKSDPIMLPPLMRRG